MEYYINKLYICNFKPFVYEEKTEKPYVTIDFSNGDNNIQSMILSGPNGYGKTSIFQAIYFLLSGIIDPGEYVDGRKKSVEHIIINDLSKPCFVAIEFIDKVGECFTFIRYTKEGVPGTAKKTEKEAADFQLYFAEGKFSFQDFMMGKCEKKTRKDIEDRIGEKNILDWINRNYIQQEHESDIVLKSDKERVNFLNNLIDMETDKYFLQVKQRRDLVQQNISSLQNEIKSLIQKVNVGVEEVQGEEPVCPQVYPKLDYFWDRERYEESEPFREYEEKARRVLEIVSHSSKYEHKRKLDLIEQLHNSESIYKFYILTLYELDKRNAYTNSFAKKHYLKKLTEEDSIWTLDLNEKYLGKDFSSKIHQIRQEHQKYLNNLDDKQRLYQQIGAFRNIFKGKEEIIGDIFNEHCPLCGSNFEGGNISFGQAVRQADNIFIETQKVLDTVLEEQAESWKTEIMKITEQITQWIGEEVKNDFAYNDIQNLGDHLTHINTLEKILNELSDLVGEDTLTIFTDKTEFRQHYKNIDEYEKAVSDLKKSIELILQKMEATANRKDYSEYEIDELAYAENREKIALLSGENGRIDSLKQKISQLQWLKKKKIALEYSSNKALYEENLIEIKKLYEKEAKLNKVLECQETARKKYLNDIMKYLEIPLYIYSGKLIQTHQNGLGIFCFTGSKENALTEFKMTTDKKEISKKLDVSNKFSTGQKNVANIALMLALKKIAATNLDVFMIDDPCQSLDELNIASFVEIIKNEFTKTQIILSTHENKIASYFKYKIDKIGKEIIMFNVHNRLYDVQN